MTGSQWNGCLWDAWSPPGQCAAPSGGTSLPPLAFWHAAGFVAYGLRLGGFLAWREAAVPALNHRSAEMEKKATPKSRLATWAFCGLLYPLMFAPVRPQGTEGEESRAGSRRREGHGRAAEGETSRAGSRRREVTGGQPKERSHGRAAEGEKSPACQH